MKYFSIISIWSVLVFGSICCAQPSSIDEDRTFKITLPYEYNVRGMMIEIYWGKDKINHKMLWDNHSPTWINDNVISDFKSFTKSKNIQYRTNTADGTRIEGDVYYCERVLVGGIEFRDVLAYKISDKIDGAIGENIISKYVWKIYFLKSTLTFASSIDSIENINEMEILPAIFSSQGIEIEVDFRNDVVTNVELDFGFNGGILIPHEPFNAVLKGNSKYYRNNRSFSTPGKVQLVQAIHAMDSFRIGTKKIATFVSSHQQAKASLIGLGFFQQFKYVVLDYINHKVYFKRY